jgi:hypothetical protein
MQQATRAAIANRGRQVGGGGVVLVASVMLLVGKQTRRLARSRFLELSYGHIQKALCTCFIRRFQASFLVAWAFVSIAHIQQIYQTAKDPRSRVGPVRSCPAGSCLRLPIALSTGNMGLQSFVHLSLLLLRIKAGTRQST